MEPFLGSAIGALEECLRSCLNFRHPAVKVRNKSEDLVLLGNGVLVEWGEHEGVLLLQPVLQDLESLCEKTQPHLSIQTVH